MSTSKSKTSRQPEIPAAVSKAVTSPVRSAATAENAPEQLAVALRAHLTAASEILQKMVPTRAEADRPRWAKQASNVMTALRLVQRECPDASMRPEDAPTDGGLDPKRWQEFAALVVKARQAVNLSQSQLAARAGLAKKTIWNVEHGVAMPSKDTIFRLLFVKELGLSSDQVPWRLKPQAGSGAAPNCWIAPGYDPLKMFADLFEAVNGPGGRLEQTFAYLDHQSADNWNKLCNQPLYALKYRARAPIGAIARAIVDATQHARLDVMALGAGDGIQETRLVENLLLAADEKGRDADLRLFLLDISQPLLSEAYKNAAAVVGREPKVTVQAIQGNFHHWPRYTQLHHAADNDHRCHLITSFGATVGNLDNEVSYFQHTLVGLAPGDLLLLDIDIAHADSANSDEILRKDPAFAHGPSAEHCTWLTGPLRSYCPDVLRIELRYSLNVLTVVPGSYAIDVVADVEFRDRSRKIFPSLFRFKRYDPKRLAATLRLFGWDLLESAPYGPEGVPPSKALLLFRKLPSVG
jgi:transcriptional regulator with XRE-family HTH domain